MTTKSAPAQTNQRTRRNVGSFVANAPIAGKKICHRTAPKSAGGTSQRAMSPGNRNRLTIGYLSDARRAQISLKTSLLAITISSSASGAVL